MKLLVQNAKMKKSSTKKFGVYNFGIPAFKSITGLKTCPNAGKCASGCYARSGTYSFSNVKNAYEQRLAATKSESFVEDMLNAIDDLLKKHEHLAIRIHDSVDFYSEQYASKWILIMQKRPYVSFYAYTKQVEMFKKLEEEITIPYNFTLIFSLGGKQDSLIDINLDRHSKVFETLEMLNSAGYVDATNDDTIAWTSNNNKIGLVYHGLKKFSNTLW